MTSFNGDDYTIKILFNMYSAQDRLEIFQSKVRGQRGVLKASTRNFTTMTAQEKADFSRQGGTSNTKDATVGDLGDGFVFNFGKFDFTYNADNGQYITTVLSKHPSRSIAYQYSMIYPVDQNMLSTARGTQVAGGSSCTPVGNNASAVGTPYSHNGGVNVNSGISGFNYNINANFLGGGYAGVAGSQHPTVGMFNGLYAGGPQINVAGVSGSGTNFGGGFAGQSGCLLYTSPSPRDRTRSRMPSSA